jgi:sporadic carbohydrate cluster 2OG-Fe(II) oxygenase
MKYKVFQNPEQKEKERSFLELGYSIFPFASTKPIDLIKYYLFEKSRDYLKLDLSVSEQIFFNHTEKFVRPDQLNDFRVYLIDQLNQWHETITHIFHCGEQELASVVGNELAIQRKANLSIQLPGDESSTLPLHTDVWSGNSPYEVVLWIPLVDCYKTKSMFVLPRAKSMEVFKNFSGFQKLNAQEFHQALEPNYHWLNVPYGKAVIFSHSLLHGNVVNEENECRWTINMRFKSLLSPYKSKEVGESFVPLNIKPATRIGYEYVEPSLYKN